MKLATTTKRIGHKLVQETTKKIVAREKAEEAQRKATGIPKQKALQEGESSLRGKNGHPTLA